MPKVSIIVPVYNIEAFVERCIESILNQNLKEIEVIIVDDGSTDNCGIICDKYANCDRRIKVIHQINKGLADARNAGLAIASGEFIMFVDGDDWVEPDFCRIPLEIAEKEKADFVIFRYDNDHNDIYDSEVKSTIRLSASQVVRYMYQNQGAMVWNKLYRRNLIQHIRFLSGRYYEDGPFTAEVILLMNNNTVFVDKVLYHWCYRKDSITKTGSIKISNDYYEMSSCTALKLEEMGYKEEAEWSRMEYNWIYLLRYGRKAKYADECLTYLRKLKQPPRYLKWRGKLMYTTLRISPCLFDIISALFGKRMKMAS